MAVWRFNWDKIFSYGEVACFLAAWIVSMWGAMLGLEAERASQTGNTLTASLEPAGGGIGQPQVSD